MSLFHKKTHQDQIWSCLDLERSITQQVCQAIQSRGYQSLQKDLGDLNYGFPFVFGKDNQRISYRFVDSLWFTDPDLDKSTIAITDNIAIEPLGAEMICVAPEFWHIYLFNPQFVIRRPRWDFNCFMNRISGERSQIFYELLRRDLLKNGLISFNCFASGDNRDSSDQTNYCALRYQQQYEQAELHRYAVEHEQGQARIPYNNLGDHTLEQCVIDSAVSLVVETYVADSHIALSEKIFRAMQLPRPWILFASPWAVDALRRAGFDVLDDCVNHDYDHVRIHSHRLDRVLQLLETFKADAVSDSALLRFQRAAEHNRRVLVELARDWQGRYESVLSRIAML